MNYRLQTKAKDEAAFSKKVLSLDAESYRSLVTDFRLPFRCLESTSAVGPFFWWAKHEMPGVEDNCLRKPWMPPIYFHQV